MFKMSVSRRGEGAGALPVPAEKLSLEAAAEELLLALPLQDDQGQLYFTPNQRPILLRYIATHLDYIQTDAHSRQKLMLATERRAIREEFDAESHVIARDEDHLATIFNVIHERTQEKAKQYKISLIQRIFLGSSLPYLLALPDAELNQQHAQCSVFQRKLDSVNEKLLYLTGEKAKLDGGAAITIEHLPGHSLDLTAAKFRISAKDLMEGYTIHNLLAVNKIYSDKTASSRPYAGEINFDISFDEFTKLDRYLSDLYVWYHDFDMILSCLLGQTAEPYTCTGQKPVSEIIKTEVERQAKGLPVFIDPRITAQLGQMPQDRVVLLLGQVALNITTHPDRVQLKALLEKMYQAHDLRDSKDDVKTFMKDHGYQYVSLLSINHIEALFDDLLANASLASIARGMGFISAASEDFLACFEATDPQVVYHRLLLQKLTELPIGQLNRERTAVELSVSDKRSLRQMAERLFHLPHRVGQVSAIREDFDRHTKAMLDSQAGIVLKPSMVAEAAELSEAQYKALLPSARPMASPLYPVAVEDIHCLFQRLKDSDAYQANIESFETYRQQLAIDGMVVGSMDECTDQLQAHFLTRIQRIASVPGSGSQYYGRGPFRLAQQELMSFISKIVYQPITHILMSSIDQAFKMMAQILMGRDMADGCELGFAGRIAELHATLSSANDNLLEAADRHLRKEIADKAFLQEVATGSESSMAYVYKQQLDVKLGLATASASPDRAVPADKEQRFYEAVARAYTPSAIYDACFSMLIDNFKAYVRDEDDEKIYQLLQQLGFTRQREGDLTPEEKTVLDGRFRFNTECRVGSRWNLSQFNLELPEALIQSLILQGKVDAPCAGKLVLQQLHSAQVFNRTELVASERAAASRVLPRAPIFGEAARHPFAASSAAAPTSASGFGGYLSQGRQPFFSGPQRAAASAAPLPQSQQRFSVFARPQGPGSRVREVAESDLTRNPNQTSSG